MKNKTVIRFVLLTIGLIILSLPQIILAQDSRTDLWMNLVPDYYPNDLKPGVDNNYFLEVRNTGTISITNIRLSANPPEGWIVEFTPNQITSIAGGSLQTVNINIKPDAKAAGGNYNITLIAEANEIRKVQSVFVQVKTASYWWWLVVGVGVVVVALFVVIFLRFGRHSLH